MGSLDTRHHEILRHPRGQRTEEGLDTGELSPRCSRAIFPQRLERSEVCRGREWRDLLEVAVRMIVSDRKFDPRTFFDLQDPLVRAFAFGLPLWGLLLGWLRLASSGSASSGGASQPRRPPSIGKASCVRQAQGEDRPPVGKEASGNRPFRLRQHPPGIADRSEKRTLCCGSPDAGRYRRWPSPSIRYLGGSHLPQRTDNGSR